MLWSKIQIANFSLTQNHRFSISVLKRKRRKPVCFIGFRSDFDKRQVSYNSIELLLAENVVKNLDPSKMTDEAMKFGLDDALRVPFNGTRICCSASNTVLIASRCQRASKLITTTSCLLKEVNQTVNQYQC